MTLHISDVVNQFLLLTPVEQKLKLLKPAAKLLKPQETLTNRVQTGVPLRLTSCSWSHHVLLECLELGPQVPQQLLRLLPADTGALQDAACAQNIQP